MNKQRNTHAKRQREVEKRAKAESKRFRRQQRRQSTLEVEAITATTTPPAVDK